MVDVLLARAQAVAARRALLVALAGAPIVVLLFAWWTPDHWLPRVIGRFHPLVVHFPVALLLAAGAAELWRVVGDVMARKAAPRGAGRAGAAGGPPLGLLFAGAASAVASVALGLLLQRGEGTEGDLVRWHLMAGITVAAGALAALALAPRPPGHARWPIGADLAARRATGYRLALLLTCGAVGVTGHLGGSLTHGEEYLTELLPELGGGEPTLAALEFPDSLPPAQWEPYEHAVAPILQARCGSCHNARNNKGKLVLVDWEGIAAGGKGGPVLVPGDVDRSHLLQRMLLPIDEKEHMPPRRKPQARPEEIEFLRRWIEAGAPREATLAALGADEEWLQLAARLPGSTAHADASTADDELHIAEFDEDSVMRVRAPAATAVAELQRRFPGAIGYESRGSADLHVNATLFGPRFGDAELTALAPIAPHVVWLDLTGTAVTDRSAGELARMERLRTLRLGGTAAGDATVAALAGLKELASLSLYHTAVTAAAAPHLARLSSLEQLYTGETELAARAR